MKRIALILAVSAALVSIYLVCQWPGPVEIPAERAVYAQERRYTSSWIRNATFADLDRHRQFAKAMGQRNVEQYPADFPITGHRIVAGRGDTLSQRVFVKQFDGIPGALVTHERLTIFFPDGLPEIGQTVRIESGEMTGPVAVYSRGLGLDPAACTGYAHEGVIGVAGAMPAGSIDTAVSGDIYSSGNTDVRLGVSEVIVHLSLYFDMYRVSSEGVVECVLPGTESSRIATNKYGIVDTFIFDLKDIETLSPWEGNAVGPLTKEEFGPEELVKTEMIVRGPHAF